MKRTKKGKPADVMPTRITSLQLMGVTYKVGDYVEIVTPEFGASATRVRGIRCYADGRPYAMDVDMIILPGFVGASVILEGPQAAEPVDYHGRPIDPAYVWARIYMVIHTVCTVLPESDGSYKRNEDGTYPRTTKKPPRWMDSTYRWRCKPSGSTFMVCEPQHRPKAVIQPIPTPDPIPGFGQLQLF